VGRPKLIKVGVSDGRGLGGAKAKSVTVQTRIPDILAFRDTPGFAYLLLAANPDVSVPVLCEVLAAVGPHQEHPRKWMYDRRGFFKTPTFPADADEREIAFVRANMGLPSWKIRRCLRDRGIYCSAAKVHRIWMAIRHLSLTE
jgi:hypothetical protein